MSIFIQTPRLILRPFTLADAKDYYKITRDPDIKKYVSYACPDSLSETIENIKSCYSQADFERDFYLVIEERRTGKIIGALSLTENFTMEYYEVCYFIDKKNRRSGYMKEALSYFLNSISTEEKIVFVINETNLSSLNLMKKFANIEDVTKQYQHILPPDEKMFCYNNP